jgi:hypothetical protein
VFFDFLVNRRKQILGIKKQTNISLQYSSFEPVRTLMFQYSVDCLSNFHNVGMEENIIKANLAQ